MIDVSGCVNLTRPLKFPLVDGWGQHKWTGIVAISEDCAGLGTASHALQFLSQYQRHSACRFKVACNVCSASDDGLLAWLSNGSAAFKNCHEDIVEHVSVAHLKRATSPDTIVEDDGGHGRER